MGVQGVWEFKEFKTDVLLLHLPTPRRKTKDLGNVLNSLNYL